MRVMLLIDAEAAKDIADHHRGEVGYEVLVRALTPQPDGDAVALDATIMEELRRGWAARDENERLRAELDRLRREDDRPRAVIMDGSSRQEVVAPLVDALVRARVALRAEPTGDSARIAALYAERGPLVDRELSGEITSDETARLRQFEGAIDRLERREELQQRISALAAAFVDERAVKAAAAKMHEITNCLCGSDGHAYEAEQVLAAACEVLGGDALHAGRVENERLQAELAAARSVHAVLARDIRATFADARAVEAAAAKMHRAYETGELYNPSTARLILAAACEAVLGGDTGKEGT